MFGRKHPNIYIRTEEHRKMMSRILSSDVNPMKGKHHTEEARAKMRAASGGNGSRFAGCCHTEESKLKISLKVRKENHPLWQGGISYEPYSANFDWQLKQSIKRRDNYTCQECGLTEAESIANGTQALDIHHIDYNKLNCSRDNLITLCKHCNGVANFNRDHWKKHFKELLWLNTEGNRLSMPCLSIK